MCSNRQERCWYARVCVYTPFGPGNSRACLYFLFVMFVGLQVCLCISSIEFSSSILEERLGLDCQRGVDCPCWADMSLGLKLVRKIACVCASFRGMWRTFEVLTKRRSVRQKDDSEAILRMWCCTMNYC